MEEPVSEAPGEQKEPAEEDNGTSVIEDENEPADPPAEIPSEEPTETPAEPVVTPEKPVEEIGSSIMSMVTILSVIDSAAIYTTGETVLTKVKKVKVTLMSDESYTITKVALGEDTLHDKAVEDAKDEGAEKKNPVGPFTIDFGAEASKKELTVTTVAKTFDTAVDITVDKGVNETVVDYTVKTGDNTVVKKKGETDTYTISKGAAYLEFDVTTVGKYTSIVEVNGTIVANPKKSEDGKYSYRYLVSRLNDDSDTLSFKVAAD